MILNLKRASFILFLTIGFFSKTSAQTGILGMPCLTSCPGPCMTIDIVNGTGCPLDFAWTYGAPGCNFVGPGITVPGSMTITGPCVQDPCDAGVCRCPTRIELQVPGSPIPWSSGDFSSLPIGTTVWDNVRPCGFCPGSGMMRLTITYAGGNNCTFTFTCM